MEYHGDRRRKIAEEEEATVKPARSFRYEDYNTRRVFLRSYPLQWDWSPDPDEKKQGLAGAASDGPRTDKNRPAYGSDQDQGDDDAGDCGGARGWRRQVVVAVVEWGEEKLLLLRRAKKRLALYLLGCHHGRPALPYRSGGSATAPMLTTR